MIGILCEKPSASRNFAKALGGMSGTYKGESYQIVAARGHLYEFTKPEGQVSSDLRAKYHSWNVSLLPWIETDFQWKYDKKKDASGTISDIVKVLKNCDEVVIATDVDPSGEGFLLGAEILLENNIRPKTFSRMYFTDESEKEIQKAFSGRKVIPSLVKDKEYLMAYYRSRWDFLSMQWTRMAVAFSDGKSVLRQGRLKSAMVKIVGDQLKAIDEYKPVPFFQNKFKDENGVIYTNKDEPIYKSKDEVPNTYTDSPVKLDSKEIKHTAPPKLLDLASLSARLAPKGYKSKDVLAVYQKMYEAQVVSYPRTEDKVITPEQFNDLLPLVDKIAKVVGVDTKLLTHRTPRSTHVKTGGAHGANRPGLNVPKSLDDLKVYGSCGPEIYKILAMNYLAMLAEDYEYESQKGHVEKYPKFVGSAQVPKKLGWKLVFNTEEDPDEDENEKGIGTHANPFVHEGVNPKPQTPTMKWLMKQLEKWEVGTGATRTSTYADVTNDKASYPLLKDTRGKISMTEFGGMSYELLPGTHIGNLEITKKVEQDMKAIADGKKSAEECLKEVRRLITEDIKVMEKNGASMRKSLGVVFKEKAEGSWQGQQISFSKTYGGHTFTDSEIKDLLDGKEIKVFGLTAKSGSKYNVKGKLEEQTYKGRKFVGFKITDYITDTGEVQEKKEVDISQYATGTWKGKEVKFKRIWGGHTFTDSEIQDLLAGKEISFEAKSERTGNMYTAKGKLANQTFQGRKFVGFKPDFGKKK